MACGNKCSKTETRYSRDGNGYDLTGFSADTLADPGIIALTNAADAVVAAYTENVENEPLCPNGDDCRCNYQVLTAEEGWGELKNLEGVSVIHITIGNNSYELPVTLKSQSRVVPGACQRRQLPTLGSSSQSEQE